MSETSTPRPPTPRREADPPAEPRADAEPPAEEACGDDVAVNGRRALAAIAVVGSPFAAATALLVYFGWVRTQVQARALGYDAGLLDSSVQDYVMRSIVVLYGPILVLASTALVLQWMHRRWVLAVVRGPRRKVWLPRLVAACTWSAVAWALLFAGLAYAVPPLAGFCAAGFFTVTMVSAFYGRWLRGRLSGSPPRPDVSNSLLLVVLALAVFWATEQVAANVGEAYAEQITTDRNRLIAVVVYSVKSLDLVGSGVVETRMTAPDALYRYRYEGLRLVQRSDKRYFLIGDGWSPQDRRVILLQESDDLRLEFYRHGRTGDGIGSGTHTTPSAAASTEMEVGPWPIQIRR
jgi:hypothetical protein